MSTGAVVVLVIAGLLAGGVNAVAGGGSLISFPAMLAAGLPPLAANVSNSVAVWPGYLGTTAAYRRELATQPERLASLGITSAVGATLGAAILLAAPEALFDAVVPILILAACLLLAVQPQVAAVVRRRSTEAGREPTIGLHASTFAAAAYGAYFGGGLGVVLLAVLGVFIADHLQNTNGLKAGLSLLINTVALLIFVAVAPISWTAVAVVAPASLVGGYLGGGLARRLRPSVLRVAVVVFGCTVAVVLLIR